MVYRISNKHTKKITMSNALEDNILTCLIGYVLKTKEISNLILEFKASNNIDIFNLKRIHISR